VRLFAIEGFADAARVSAYPHDWVKLGRFGALADLVRQAGCQDVVFIGSLTRPRLRDFRIDFDTLRLLPRLWRLYRGGDNHLLSGVGAIVEERGFRLLGAHEVAPEILMPQGVLTARTPNDADRADIARGFDLLRAIGSFDVGQSVVVANNHVLGVEGVGGTDALLAHLSEVRERGKLKTARGAGVLVKGPKPDQDRRFDLPTIGPKTAEAVAAAGLGGIAVAAGETIALDLQALIDAANRANVFLVGIRAS